MALLISKRSSIRTFRRSDLRSSTSMYSLRFASSCSVLTRSMYVMIAVRGGFLGQNLEEFVLCCRVNHTGKIPVYRKNDQAYEARSLKRSLKDKRITFSHFPTILFPAKNKKDEGSTRTDNPDAH